MGRMSAALKWWSRAGAAVTGMIFAVVVPVHAWAATNGVTDVAVEAARSRRRGGFGFGSILGLVCCFVVVGGIVLAVVLISRRRKR